jgi:hypothetical protein
VPVIQGLLWLRRPHHWVVRDLEVTWREGLEDDDHLVKITGGIGWTLDGLHVHDAESYAGILVVSPEEAPGEPAGWRLTGSCVADTRATNETNQDHLVYVNPGVDAGPGLIDANVLVGAPNGTGIKMAGPTPDSGGAARVVVAGNVIAEVVHGVLVGGASTDNLITRNRFAAIEEAAIRSFRLLDPGTSAVGNVVVDGELFSDYDSPLASVVDGGGNVLRDGTWERPRCATGGTGLERYVRGGASTP